MSVSSGEKRKNDEPRRFQWSLLVIGIVIGLLLSLVVMQSRFSSTVVYLPDNANIEGIELTATAIVAGATGTAGMSGSQLSDETLYMTATQIIIEATQQAASTPAP